MCLLKTGVFVDLRPCGPCSECCTNLGVVELNKPENTKCGKLEHGRCSCYVQRPTSCRQFDCLWRHRLLPTNLRPDKTHVVPYAVDDIVVLHVSPAHRGAQLRGNFKKWLETLDPNLSVMVQCDEERDFLGPVADRIKRGHWTTNTKTMYGTSATTLDRPPLPIFEGK